VCEPKTKEKKHLGYRQTKICASLLFLWRQWRKSAHNSTLMPRLGRSEHGR
jgi:hypothetical protein